MKRRLIRFSGLMLVLSVAVALLLPGCPGNNGTRYVIRVTDDIAYAVGNVAAPGGGWTRRPLLLDVFEPENAPVPRPALILVHGGSFTEGGKDKPQIVQFANHFTARGYVCFSIAYRLTADNPPAPQGWEATNLTSSAHAAMVDVKAAIRFVHANQALYNVDPTRIAVLGESAGAIAAVAAVMTPPADFAVDGPDFPLPAENNPDESTEVAAYIHLWGNADHVLTNIGPNDPPVMIVHGEDDDNIYTPLAAAERFHTVLELWNVPHEFYIAENEDHGAWGYRLRGQNLRELTATFLDAQLP